MNAFKRIIRATVIQSLMDTGRASFFAELAVRSGAGMHEVSRPLHALATEHRFVIVPGTTRLDVDWEPATLYPATETFARHGLTGEFYPLV